MGNQLRFIWVKTSDETIQFRRLCAKLYIMCVICIASEIPLSEHVWAIFFATTPVRYYFSLYWNIKYIVLLCSELGLSSRDGNKVNPTIIGNPVYAL